MVNKKLALMAIVFFIVSLKVVATESWTPVSPEQVEYRRLNEECVKIKDYYASLSNGNEALSSLMPKIAGAIFQYLKDVGTPTSLKLLKDMIKNKEIPEHYLKMI